MATALELSAQSGTSEKTFELRALISARRGLIKDQTAARTRLATAELGVIKSLLNRRLSQISKDIAQIDADLLVLVKQDHDLNRRIAILSSILGIGRLTGVTLVIDMPELGSMDAKQAASLAGLAPVPQSSSRWQGKERIQGGRALLRKALYMPALVASRANKELAEKYNHLVTAGKPKKVALTVLMRKLLVLANALLRDDRVWMEKTP